MKLNKQWRILTVGDGDLSFSHSLSLQFPHSQLIASVYDSEAVLLDKYKNNAYSSLKQKQVKILTEFDVTEPRSWHRISSLSVDVVIFQFPLIPAFSDFDDFKQQSLSVNTLNRRLLRLYIYFAHKYVLDPAGPMLCIITSKDVKPYREWDIETALLIGLENQKKTINYLGQMNFDINAFPGYKIRNVDRDKHVKDTQGNVYVFSNQKQTELIDKLAIPNYAKTDLSNKYCAFCRVGPFYSHLDKLEHLNSKRHKKMSDYHNQWLHFLNAT